MSTLALLDSASPKPDEISTLLARPRGTHNIIEPMFQYLTQIVPTWVSPTAHHNAEWLEINVKYGFVSLNSKQMYTYILIFLIER